MPRSAASEPRFGSDSFLDVTANLVGVLIILIVLVGLRVAKAPLPLLPSGADTIERVAEARSALDRLRLEQVQVARQLDASTEDAFAKTAALAEYRSHTERLRSINAALGRELADQRDRLSEDQAALGEARTRLAALDRETRELGDNAEHPRPLVYRSPLSRPVNGDELHFELRGGRITLIDLNGLLERAKGMAKQGEVQLRDHGEATMVTGTIGRFRLRFTMAREEIPFTQSLMYSSGSFRARLVDWEAEPVDAQRGEDSATASQAASQWHVVLARHAPKKFAVTLWVYPESFMLFRQTRDELYELGYSVAARPLPSGFAIRGSSRGSRSFTQ